MAEKARIYAAIDLKSFYASVECVLRGLDPLNTNLVVADESRTEKTICLAVTPSLKSYGIPGRARLFEVIQKVREINAIRRLGSPNKNFSGKSYLADELNAHPEYELDYITAPPRMAEYMKFSLNIYDIYLEYVAPEDIYVYSVDEVFIDLTPYLETYKTTAHKLTERIVSDVFRRTGITATAGIGTNLYLSKVAMDIVAKHAKPDADGARIAELDEKSYRKMLWSHEPITDFWRVGSGYAKKLAEHGIYTMGDVARCSLGTASDFYNEELLYRLFGVNAEFLIDHAWGIEPCTISEIKDYKPLASSLSSGQVLKCPYSFEKARLVVREMTELLALDLVRKGLVTDQLVLTVGYDVECLSNPEIRRKYFGEVTGDRYGRKVPKHSHGTVNLPMYMSSSKRITDAVDRLFVQIVNKELLVRRMYVAACRLKSENDAENEVLYEQPNLFSSLDEQIKNRERELLELEKERSLQKAILKMSEKYGKNAVLKGMNLCDGATTVERNGQLGGHKA